MSTTQHKMSGKAGQRSRKADQRSQKPDPQQSPKLDERDAEDQIDATVASAETSSIGAAALEDVPSSGAAAPADVPPIGAVVPANVPLIGQITPAFPIGIQTIANAYGDYTKKSFQETCSFVEKLTGVRSLDQAIEIQAEFARQAYETFLAESQKICELYSEVAKQIFKPWEGFVAKRLRGQGDPSRALDLRATRS